MACHRRRNVLQHVVYPAAAIEAIEILPERTKRRLHVTQADESGHRRHAYRLAAEWLDVESEALEIPKMRFDTGQLGGVSLEDQRREQPLALEPAAGQPLVDAFVEDALVRHVLIDDRQAVPVHRENVRVPELPERLHRQDRIAGDPTGRRFATSGV